MVAKVFPLRAFSYFAVDAVDGGGVAVCGVAGLGGGDGGTVDYVEGGHGRFAGGFGDVVPFY